MVVKLASAFADWVDMIHRSRRLLAEDKAQSEQADSLEPALSDS